MEVVEPLVSFTVRNLCNLLIEKGRFLGLVREQVEDMKKELTRMQRFLIDADRRREEGDASVTNWVVEIRELAYDAEDVIATFVVKVARRPAEEASRSFQLCFHSKRCIRFVKSCITRHVVGTQIQQINSKIAAIARSLQTYGVQATVVDAKVPRITYSTVVEENVVGLQDDLRTVVAHLKDKTSSRVVSIWGIGGLGKTTFSKEILRHREIQHHFDHVAWVCVSQQCNQHQVWRDILLQFFHQSEEKNEIRNLTSNELVSKLHSMQMDKKCLVILDDIWKQEDWNSLSPAFPRVTETGSKIVLTTRNKGVLSHADIQCLLYELPFLKKEDCLELLEKKVALERQGFRMNTEMKNVIEEIVEHCGGLPLAIVLVGGLLAKDKTFEGWEKVHQDLNYYLNKGNDRHGGVSDVLALSYHNLPYHLKACFLYLSLFPEDYDIEAKMLVQMWIAEGFVSAATRGERTKASLDVGFSYLDELVNRCMVQATFTKFSKRVKTCHLHDLMREFCMSKAQEENFSNSLHLQHSDFNTCSSPSGTVRRLAVYIKDGQQEVFTKPHDQHLHVRSCLVHWPSGKDGWDKINSLVKGFKFLKVFDRVGFPIYTHKGKLSEDIGKLIHLRYLGVSGAKVLPSSLGNLVLLQTLDLRTDIVGVGDVIIPDVLWKLKELRHLYLPGFSNCFSKLHLGGLSKLETLVNFDASCSAIGDLATLPNLRKLKISFCEVSELGSILEYPMFSESNSLLRCSTFHIDGAAKTQDEHNILCQVLACPRVTKFSLSGRVYDESLLHNLNTKITSIEFSECEFKEDPMPVLGKMANLRTLELGPESYTGKMMVCLGPKQTMAETSSGAGSFPQLTRLWLDGLNISEWKVDEGAMPCLSELNILNCKKLKKIPDGLLFIVTLQTLWIRGVTEPLKQRLQEGGEDFYKIQHVPSFTIA